MKNTIFLFFFLPLCVFGFTPPQHSLASYVTDYGNIFNPAQEQELQKLISSSKSTTKAQGAILTITSFEGLEPSDYAVQTFKSWGVGDKDLNNGWLLVVCVPERKWHLTTGYGIENKIQDGWISGTIKPMLKQHFKASDYFGGMKEAVGLITARINEGVASGEVKTIAESKPSAPIRWWLFWTWVIGLAGVSGLIYIVYKEKRRRDEIKAELERQERERIAIEKIITTSLQNIKLLRSNFENSVSKVPDNLQSHFRSIFNNLEAKSTNTYTLAISGQIDYEKKRDYSIELNNLHSQMEKIIRDCGSIASRVNKLKAFRPSDFTNQIYTSQQMANKAQNALNNIGIKYPARKTNLNIQSELTRIQGQGLTLISEYETAMINSDWNAAETCIKSIVSMQNQAQSLVYDPISLEQSLETAKQSIRNRLHAAKIAYQEAEEARRLMQAEGAEDRSANNNLVEYKAHLDRYSTGNLIDNLDPLECLASINELESTFNTIRSKFKKAKEAQIRRKEDAEEDERRRRRRNSSSSSSSSDWGSSGGFGSSDWGGSNSSSSSDSGSFGGGDSGGGGGGGDW